MFSVPSLLRLEEHRAFSNIALSGKVLDLGGDKNSEYTSFSKENLKLQRLIFPKTRGRMFCVIWKNRCLSLMLLLTMFCLLMR